MRKKKQSKFPAKYVLLIMSILCAVIIGCSLKTSGSGPVSAAAGAVLAPMQKGVNQLGSGQRKVWKKKMKNFGHSWQMHSKI